MTNETELIPCPIEMTEITAPKEYKGWYNLTITDGGYAIAMLSPNVCQPFLDIIAAWNTRAAHPVPDGFVLVPVEPTYSMVGAFITAQNNGFKTNDSVIRNGYKAMIAAAQKEKK